jgi:hypothetical protein
MRNATYIGDGLYMVDDGYQVWIAIGDHHSTVAAIEPSIAASVVNYLLKSSVLGLSIQTHSGEEIDNFQVVSSRA